MTAGTRHSYFRAVVEFFCLFVVAATVTAMLAQAAPRTLWERHDGPFSSRALLWNRSDLTEGNLRLLYSEVSKELGGKRAWTVEIFVDEGDATREMHGKLRTEGDYDWWLDLYNQFGRRLLPMAQISGYKGSGVLRFRDVHGNSTEMILAGENFLRVRLEGVDFEILKTYYHPLPPGTEPSIGDEAMVSLYVRASSFPSRGLAKEFSRLMQTRFEERRLTVAFRTDAYFLTDGAFPIVYRFDDQVRPPSRADYENSHTMYCFCDVPGIQCR